MLILLTREFPQLFGEILFSTTFKGVVLVPWTLEGVLLDTWKNCVFCNSLGNWLMVLTYEGVSLVISNQLKDVLDPSKPLEML